MMSIADVGYAAFLCVEKLYSERKYSQVIRMLIETRSGKLNKAYSVDANHAWYMAGVSYYELGDKRKAMVAFRQSLRYKNDDVLALFAVGNCYSDFGKAKLAERYFRKSLYFYFYPKKFASLTKYDIIYNLANSLFTQGRYRDAVELYDEIDTVGSEIRKLAKGNKKAALENLKILKSKKKKN